MREKTFLYKITLKGIDLEDFEKGELSIASILSYELCIDLEDIEFVGEA